MREASTTTADRWRSGRDSNSRTGYAGYGISSAAPSTRLGDRSAANGILSAVALARAAALARGPALEVEYRRDHREVGQRLRKVAQHLAGPWVVFLRKQAEIVRRLGDPAEELLGLID